MYETMKRKWARRGVRARMAGDHGTIVKTNHREGGGNRHQLEIRLGYKTEESFRQMFVPPYEVRIGVGEDAGKICVTTTGDSRERGVNFAMNGYLAFGVTGVEEIPEITEWTDVQGQITSEGLIIPLPKCCNKETRP